MSRRFTQNLLHQAAAYQQFMHSCQELASLAVQGRHAGVEVTYTGLGAVTHLEVDETAFTTEGRLDVKQLQQAVVQAVLNANEKLVARKKDHWQESPNSSISFEEPANLPPFPFDVLDQCPTHLDTHHLSDGIHDPKVKAKLKDAERQRAQESAMYRKFDIAYQRELKKELKQRSERQQN
eukprot:NODE_4912_length_723_cov_19.620805_g4749_i0.p1 GENE.NODE_4912_length_723_cov_19.620805_g4749_i0~~NODE_4912_length_723_cov_19.620805_g4749_i0.p1  ORF type:complete len:197 (-),score=70.27 NODE_4912_length_723_cov_19.620805_g4749_i0:133-672(-)